MTEKTPQGLNPVVSPAESPVTKDDLLQDQTFLDAIAQRVVDILIDTRGGPGHELKDELLHQILEGLFDEEEHHLVDQVANELMTGHGIVNDVSEEILEDSTFVDRVANQVEELRANY